jgi:hypothetical protein
VPLGNPMMEYCPAAFEGMSKPLEHEDPVAVWAQTVTPTPCSAAAVTAFVIVPVIDPPTSS